MLDLLVNGGWRFPAQVAALAAAIGIGIVALIGAATIVSALLASPAAFREAFSGPDVDWGVAGRAYGLGLLVFWVGAHGAFGFVGMTLTGLGWIALSFVLAVRRTCPAPLGDRYAILRVGLKVGVIYATVVTGVALILGSMTVTSFARFVGGPGVLPFEFQQMVSGIRPLGEFITPLSGLLVAMVVGCAASIGALAHRGRLAITDVFGLRALSSEVKGILRGSLVALALSVLAMLVAIAVVLVVAGIRAQSGLPGLFVGPSPIAAGAPMAVLTLLIGGVDLGLGGNVGLLLLLFPSGAADAVQAGEAVPGWVYLGLAIPALAALKGGQVAAREAHSQDRTAATRAGALIGAAVASLVFVWTLLLRTWVDEPFVLAATAWSLLWFGVFGAIGGFMFASQVGLPERLATPRARREMPTTGVVGHNSGAQHRGPWPEQRYESDQPVPAPRPRQPQVAAPPERSPHGESSSELDLLVPPTPPAGPQSHRASAAPSMEDMPGHGMGDDTSALADVSHASAAPGPELEDEVACSECGGVNPSSSKFCGLCGEVVPELIKVCSGCGEMHPLELRFCRSCGSRLDRRSQ